MATLWNPIFKFLLLPDLPHIVHLTKVVSLGYLTRKPGCFFFLLSHKLLYLAVFLGSSGRSVERERENKQQTFPTKSLDHSSSNNTKGFYVLRVLGAYLPIAAPRSQGCTTRNGTCLQARPGQARGEKYRGCLPLFLPIRHPPSPDSDQKEKTSLELLPVLVAIPGKGHI